MHVVVYNYEIYLHRTAYLIPTWMNSINNVPTLSRSANAQRRKFKYCGTVKIPLGVYNASRYGFWSC